MSGSPLRGPSALTPSRGRTLADTAASEVHRMILAGELPAGSPLRLNDLAALLEMSPMPVRDAMRRLEALGLVEIIPHKGARVRELTEDDLRDTYEVRIELESLATARAALIITPEAVERAAEALASHEQLLLAGDVDNARRAHTDFHFAIYRASGSLWLPRAIEPVWQNSERYRFATADAERRRLSHLEHQAILDACAAHDADAAAAALRSHLESTMHRILAAMSARG
ncbi:GntR family transcriptional regulator [Actinocorallia sp. A-T 12471]|uniref:GntR family transcriptional regulator n=1 Tax=Actinocorallia sp. A-T 12471 TaxID=3089813 RepID=UPI0029D02239|nr:GntR family transcriptional regulator [Actinocorallia sp. A-T 12471]MDX6738774.1 GntR family transcriptional regulator [Actinocorallia sp. A-T 12471]